MLTRQHAGYNIINNADLEANLHRMHNIIHAERPMTSKKVRLCKTDTEKFRLYAEIRNRLLDQYTQVELLIALSERIILANYL